MSAGNPTVDDSDLDAPETLDTVLRKLSRAPSISPGPQPGEVIDGTFRIERKLGAGGMGEVHLARDLRLQRLVGLKIHAGREGFAERTQREAKVMAQLSHPNVVTVYEVGTWKGRTYIAMEYLDGGTLRTWLEDRTHAWREILGVFLKAARGLAAAHDAGLVHRDFKPDNVLLGGDGRVRVADFGLARPVRDGDEPATNPDPSEPSLDDRLTSTGARMGTPRYMSPEALRGDEVDARSDQYAFCIALDEAVGKRRPPRWLARLVARGLEEDPDRRWPSMAALVGAIERARRRRRAALGGAAVSIVAAGALLAAWRLGATPDRRCTGAAAQLRAAWNPEREGALRRALGADADGVVAALDRYGREWVDMHEAACVATRVRGDQSDALLEVRMACLDRGRAQLGAVATLIATEPAAAAHARDAIAALPLVTRCGDVELLRAERPPPDDPARAAQVAALTTALGAAEARWRAGQFSAARAELEVLLPRARATGWDPLIADAAYQLGRVRESLGEDPVPLFREAVQAAIAGGDGDLEVEAFLSLSYASTDQAAADWLALAEASLRRIGARPPLTADVLSARASQRRDAGALAEAETLQRQAVEAAGVAGSRPGDLGIALRGLGIIQMYAGRAPDARATFTDALAELDRVFSPDSAEIQGARLWQISVLQHLGDLDAAATLARDALTALRRMQGHETLDTAGFLLQLADVLRMHGDLDDSVAALDEARVIVAAAPVPDDAMLGQISMIRASAQVGLDLDVAKSDALAAVAAYQRAYPAGDARLVPSRVVLGAIERVRGEITESARELEAALALAEQTLPATDQHRLEAALELADTRLAQGRAAEAIVLAEPVVTALAGGGNAGMLAHAQDTLARAREAH